MATPCTACVTVTCSSLVPPPGTGDSDCAVPSVAVTPPSASGTVAVPYSSSVAAAGGTAPYIFAVTAGQLPAGLSLNASTGAVTGTPTTAGTAPFTVTATD